MSPSPKALLAPSRSGTGPRPRLTPNCKGRESSKRTEIINTLAFCVRCVLLRNFVESETLASLGTPSCPLARTCRSTAGVSEGCHWNRCSNGPLISGNRIVDDVKFKYRTRQADCAVPCGWRQSRSGHRARGRWRTRGRGFRSSGQPLPRVSDPAAVFIKARGTGSTGWVQLATVP